MRRSAREKRKWEKNRWEKNDENVYSIDMNGKALLTLFIYKWVTSRITTDAKTVQYATNSYPITETMRDTITDVQQYEKAQSRSCIGRKGA